MVNLKIDYVLQCYPNFPSSKFVAIPIFIKTMYHLLFLQSLELVFLRKNPPPNPPPTITPPNCLQTLLLLSIMDTSPSITFHTT